MTTENVISAIIGYWRMGATLNEMNSITSVPVSVIEKIILDYEAESNDREWEA